MEELEFDKRARAREIAAQFAEKGDRTGWFDALYKEAAGNNELIPWADLEPNRFFKRWAERAGLKGNGRTALVVGCGLGDDARYLHDLGFKVTGFDISPTAIEWARKLHADTDISFEVADLFHPPIEWTAGKNPPATAGGSDKSAAKNPPATAGGSDKSAGKNPPATAGGSDKSGGFDFVLEVYTIQPLPLEMRPQVIDAIASFAAPGGELVAVGRLRENDDEVDQVPWPLSRADLSRFEENGLTQVHFEEMEGDEDPPEPRFVVVYKTKAV